MGQVAEHFFGGHRETIGHGIKDALVGLMQQQPIQGVCGDTTLSKQLFENRRHLAHRKFVDLLAVHLNGIEAAALMAGVSHQGLALAHLGELEHLAAAAIGAQQESVEIVLTVL